MRALVTPIERAVRQAGVHLMGPDAVSGATNGHVRAEAGAEHPSAAGGSRMN